MHTEPQNVIIFGIGTFASVIAQYLGDVAVRAYTVDAEYCKGKSVFEGKPLVPFLELHHVYPAEQYKLCIAVTQQNGHRDLLKNKYKQARSMRYFMVSFVHPKSIIPGTIRCGEGVLVSPGAVVENNTELGCCTYVRSGAYVGHDCHLGDFVYVAPRASISGHVTIENGAFIGNNATLRDRIHVGENAIIGAGAVVLRDVKPNEVYKAMEARLLSADAREMQI